MAIELKKVTLEALPVLSEKIKSVQNGDCNISLFSLIGRSDLYHIEYAVVNDHLVLHWQPYEEASPCWVLPNDCTGCIVEILKEIDAQAHENKKPVVLYGRFNELTERIECWMPYRNFLTISSNSWWDYLYLRETFVKLEGRKLHGKRNFIKRFYQAHPNAQFLPLNEETIPLCRPFLNKWYEDYGELTDSLISERKAIEMAFDNWNSFQVQGGVLVDGDEVMGFTFGSMVAPDIFAVHIEKADRNVTGSYPTLAQKLAESLPETVVYLNREEDMGIAGIRKAKQDWFPSGVIRKTYMKLEPESEFGSNAKARNLKS